MANKKTQRSAGKQPAKPQMMTVNKSQTPAWMRVVIVAVIISFAAGGIAIVAGTLGGSGGSGGSVSTSKDPAVLASQGDTFFDQAAQLYQNSQYDKALPYWKKAVEAYDASLALQPDNDTVIGDRAFALVYAGDPRAETALQAFIDAAADNTSLADQVANARDLLAQLQSQNTTSSPTPTVPSP